MNTNKITAAIGLATALGLGIAACGSAIHAAALKPVAAHSPTATSPSAAQSPAPAAPASPQLNAGGTATFTYGQAATSGGSFNTSMTWKLNSVTTPATVPDADYNLLNMYGGLAPAGSEFLVLNLTITNDSQSTVDPADFPSIGTWEWVSPSGQQTQLEDGQITQPIFGNGEYNVNDIAQGKSFTLDMVSVVPLGSGSLALDDQMNSAPDLQINYATKPAASAAASAAILPVFIVNGIANAYNGRDPATIDYSGDSSNVATDLVWSSWTATGAQASGTVIIQGCNPNCAQGSQSPTPVTITLSNPVNGVFMSMTETIQGQNPSHYTYSSSSNANWALNADQASS